MATGSGGSTDVSYTSTQNPTMAAPPPPPYPGTAGGAPYNPYMGCLPPGLAQAPQAALQAFGRMFAREALGNLCNSAMGGLQSMWGGMGNMANSAYNGLSNFGKYAASSAYGFGAGLYAGAANLGNLGFGGLFGGQSYPPAYGYQGYAGYPPVVGGGGTTTLKIHSSNSSVKLF